MKIIRACLNGVYVYAHDEINGKAEISAGLWREYLRALEIIADVEKRIDNQYEMLNENRNS